MKSIAQHKAWLGGRAGTAALAAVYGKDEATVAFQAERVIELLDEFQRRFGDVSCEIVRASGRIEVGGNHTDHNHGHVLAAAVDHDFLAVAAPSRDRRVTMFSAGYPRPFSLDINTLVPSPGERGNSSAMVRGVAAGLDSLGFAVGGFEACVHSRVLRGSGLSSSAGFECLISVILERLFNPGKTMDAVDRAKVCQIAENKFFGKPCGLMDQMAVSCGALSHIDFADVDAPAIEQLHFNFAKAGYCIAVVDTGGSHATLTEHYAAVRDEMHIVAKAMGKKVLRQVDETEFFQEIPRMRAKLSDRSLLRAMHFFDENRRVLAQVEALASKDIKGFLRAVVESGDSSLAWLQNIYVPDERQQGMALGLKMSSQILQGSGAWRVHGGGFAGTLLAFVPHGQMPEYQVRMEAIFGEGSCQRMAICDQGAGTLEGA